MTSMMRGKCETSVLISERVGIHKRRAFFPLFYHECRNSVVSDHDVGSSDSHFVAMRLHDPKLKSDKHRIAGQKRGKSWMTLYSL